MRNGVRLALLLAKRLLRLGLARDAMSVFHDVEKETSELSYRRRSLEGQARAARMLREWEELQSIVARWQEWLGSTNAVPPVHSSMELLSFEAHFYQASTLCTLPKRIDKCVVSQTSSTGHRLAAAALALIQADNCGDEAGARFIYNAIRDLRPLTHRQQIDYLTIGAVFHSSFGEPSQVPALLSDLVELTRRLQQPVLRADLMRRAAWGLVRFSSRALARDVLQEAISVFERLRLPGQLAHCLEHVCIIDLHEGDFDAVSSSLGKIRDVNSQTSGFYAVAVEYEIRVFLAFELGSVTPLDGFVPSRTAFDPLRKGTRSGLKIAALELGEDLVRGTPFAESFESVDLLHRRFRSRCDQDFVVAVLVEALRRFGRRDEAASRLTDYLLHQRREMSSLLPSLIRQAGHMGVAVPLQYAQPIIG